MNEMGDDGLRPDGSQKGWSLARKYYKDRDIYEVEVDRIIFNSWIFAGHVSQVPESGDYFLFNLLEESAIVVRGKNGVVKAFYNVCRHRGAHVCASKSGNAKRFTCPYHAWSYNIDGKLIAARGMAEDFDKAVNGLHPCAMEIIDGMIFLNFSDNPPSLDQAKHDLRDPMLVYGFEHMKVADHKRYDIAANWKVTVENYQECYHCAPSHPEYAMSHTLKVDRADFAALQEPMMTRMKACGLTHHAVNRQFDQQEEGQEQYAFSRYALFEKYKTGSQDGEPLAPLLGDIKGYDHGATDINIGPLTYYLCYNDHVVVYVFTPTGHETSACDIYWLVRGDAVQGVDYDLGRLTWLWDVTTQADEHIVVENQKGINSRKYGPGQLSEMEYMVERMITWYLGIMHD